VRSIAALRRQGADLPPYDHILYARVQIFQSEYAEATESVDRALMKLTEAHALWVRAKALSTKANALLFWGRLGDAHRTVTTGIELANKNENAPWLGILLSTLAWLRWETFDFDGLEALANDVEQSAKSTVGLQKWLRATANVAGATIRILQAFADLAAERHDRASQRFAEIYSQNAHPKFGLSWHRRMLAQLGLSETWLALGEWARATAEADALVKDASECGDSYLKARALEMRARLALASGKPEAAERYVQQALDAVTIFNVPLAAWRVHRTAGDVFGLTNSARAAKHRAHAERVVLELAASLADVESLRQTFLSAQPVRDVLDGKLNGNLDATLAPPLVQQS
jgi:tetratricopeptide (TPR) repeat protein